MAEATTTSSSAAAVATVSSTTIRKPVVASSSQQQQQQQQGEAVSSSSSTTAAAAEEVAKSSSNASTTASSNASTTASSNAALASSASTTSAILIYDATLTLKLATNEYCLPPTYIGVRRVRPSSHMVRNIMKEEKKKKNKKNKNNIPTETAAVERQQQQQQQQSHNQQSVVIYKMIDPVSGLERRMNGKEKKELKMKRKLEWKEQKQQQKQKQKQQEDEEEEKKRKMLLIQQEKQKEQEESCQQELDKSHDDHHDDERSTAIEATTSETMLFNNTAIQSLMDDTTINTTTSTGDSRYYMPFPISKAALQQEIADLCGERQGVPPVALSPAQAHAAFVSGILQEQKKEQQSQQLQDDHHRDGEGCIGRSSSSGNPTRSQFVGVTLDDDLAMEWAKFLKVSMDPATDVRRREDMRPLAYELSPEVWTRMRPKNLHNKRNTSPPPPHPHPPTSSSSCSDNNNIKNELALQDNHLERPICGDEPQTTMKHTTTTTKDASSSTASASAPTTTTTTKEWGHYEIRPPSLLTTIDNDLAAVAEILHCNSSSSSSSNSNSNSISSTIHISCGSKFGCDLLLYDGPRSERHAFAGLRVIPWSSTTTKTTPNDDDVDSHGFPIPRPYDLHGYVRCLNTAAKLALLATVRWDTTTGIGHVAILDLALQKVVGLTTRTRKSKRCLQKK